MKKIKNEISSESELAASIFELLMKGFKKVDIERHLNKTNKGKDIISFNTISRTINNVIIPVVNKYFKQ